ncbi:MAG: PrsW family intramembrane metalloprotease [Bacteroidales bacterium]|nr:PrsW family intramembrane metalloprotease [Bacteroidales bacterium]
MLVIIAAALLPALVLMWYVYNKDTQPEPTRLIVKGFFYGGLATFVSTLISGPLLAMGFFTGEPQTFAECMTTSFFGAAIPEECAKLLMLWLLLRHNPEFDERYDGIVYAAAVGLGFASFENIMYVISAGADWFTVSLTRALLAVPGHFAFAVMMGYYYSVDHFYGSYAPKGTKAKIILVPVLLHGIYDTIAFASGLGTVISGVLTFVLLYFCYRLFKYTRAKILTEASDNDIRAKIMRDSDPSDNLPDEQ